MDEQVGVLIGEINNIVAAGEFDKAKLTPASRAVLDMLPVHTQQQLLLDRDPHGNVQVTTLEAYQTTKNCAAGFYTSPSLPTCGTCGFVWIKWSRYFDCETAEYCSSR